MFRTFCCDIASPLAGKLLINSFQRKAGNVDVGVNYDVSR